MPLHPLPHPARRRGFRAAVVALGLAALSAAAQAPGDLRLALVIGNSAYPAPASLANPVNDARAMAQAVRRLGFTVIDLHDASKAQMAEAVARMREALQGRRGVGMLYYAGHGVQHDWRNFMVPVDARLQGVADIPQRTVDVAEVLEAFRAAGNRLNLVVLDACRDNPFDNTLATKGLAPVDAPPGTFMAFATTPGNLAEDGDDGSANGLYTRFLVQELQRPAARLEDVFKRVKLQVRQHSQGRQVPSESSNLDEEFSFDKGFARADGENQAARLARFAAERAEWQRIQASQNAADFFAFLQRHPSSFLSEIAQFRYDQLQKPLLVAQQRRDGIVALASGTNRFALGDEFTLVVTDRLTGLVRREPQRVTLATNERVEINGGASIYDQMGGVYKDDSGVKDPPVMLVPADIALGKRWRAVFQNSVSGFTLRTVVDFRTVALEDLEIEGTRMKAFRVEMEGSSGPGRIRGTVWIEPATMRMVRWEREVRAGGAILDATTLVVAGYRPARR